LPRMTRSFSLGRIVHLLSVYDPTGHAARPPHVFCRGKRRWVRSWCGFRGVGCVLGFLPNPTVNPVQCLGGERQITRRTNGHPAFARMAVRQDTIYEKRESRSENLSRLPTGQRDQNHDRLNKHKRSESYLRCITTVRVAPRLSNLLCRLIKLV